MVTYELKTLFLQYSTGVLHQLTNKKLWSLNFLLTIIESPQLHPQSSVLNYKAVPETVFKTFEEEKHRCWQRASSEEELIKSRYNLWITACLTVSPQFFFIFHCPSSSLIKCPKPSIYCFYINHSVLSLISRERNIAQINKKEDCFSSRSVD